MTREEKLDRARKLAEMGEFDAADRLIASVRAGRDQSEAGGMIDYLRAGAQGIFLGHGDEIVGALGMLAGQDYQEVRDAERAKLSQFQAESPLAAAGAEIVGGLLAGGGVGALGRGGRTAANLMYGGAVRNAPTLGGRIASNAAGGATAGSLYGAGVAEEMGDVPAGMLAGGAVGAGAGAVLGPVVDRLTVGRTQPKSDELKQVLDSTPELLDEMDRMVKLNPMGDTTVADLSSRGLVKAKQGIAKMLMSENPDDVKEAHRLLEFYQNRKNATAQRIEGVLRGPDMPFYADANPAHFNNFVNELSNHSNPDIRRTAGLALMNQAHKGRRGDIRSMLEGMRSDVGSSLYGPHHAVDMGDMSAFTKGKHGMGKAVRRELANARDRLKGNPGTGVADANSWWVWQEVRSELAKQSFKKGTKKTSYDRVIRNLDDVLEKKSNKQFNNANVAYREMSKLLDAFDMAKDINAGNVSGEKLRQVSTNIDNMSSLEKKALLYGMGDSISMRLQAKKGGSLSGFLEPTLASGEAGQAKIDILKKLVPDDQVKMIDGAAKLERLMERTAKELSHVESLAMQSSEQGKMAQELFALTTEVGQQVVNTASGSVMQVWPWHLIYNRLNSITGSMKLRAKDREMVKLLTEVQSTVGSLGDEIEKAQNKIIQAGEIATQNAARLTKYGIMSGLHDYQWDVQERQ